MYIANKYFKINYCLLCCFSLLIACYAQGQNSTADSLIIGKPKGVFLKDTIALGERVLYALSFYHPENLQVIFPDSSYDFSPYQVLSKQYFSTQSNATHSLDSALYELTLFDIFPSYSLQVPVFVLNEGDSVATFTALDSIILKEVVAQPLEKLDFASDTGSSPLPVYFNYPLMITSIIGFILIIILIWGLLGKRISKVYVMFQFRTRHQIFLNDFNRLSTRIENRENITDIEKIISIWKKQMEYLVEKPFSSFTSKEIIHTIPNQDLASALKKIDRALYGKEFSEELGQSLNTICEITIQQFEKKRALLRER